MASSRSGRKGNGKSRSSGKPVLELKDHIVEIISDSGEGAQKAGQGFGTVSAKMGNGVWTVEIIPAEIQPPARSIAGASGNRIRLGSKPINNGGDQADLVIAFNEQVLLGRVRDGELKPGCVILLESMWGEHRDAGVRALYAETVARLNEDGYQVVEIPMERECLKHVSDARKGKNMFVLGMLCSIYSLDPELGREQVAFALKKKDRKVVEANQRLLDAGFAWAEENLDLKFSILHWYEMTLSAGYAVGFKGGKRAGDEWMVSLKIM